MLTYTRDKIGRLLSDFGGFVVKPPQNGTTDLRQIGLNPFAQLVYNSAESIKHNNILCGLFLERVQNTWSRTNETVCKSVNDRELGI